MKKYIIKINDTIATTSYNKQAHNKALRKYKKLGYFCTTEILEDE